MVQLIRVRGQHGQVGQTGQVGPGRPGGPGGPGGLGGPGGQGCQGGCVVAFVIWHLAAQSTAEHSRLWRFSIATPSS